MIQQKTTKLERLTYLLGAMGAVTLLLGVVLVLLCKGEHPCIHERFLRITYVAGHSLLLLSALIFCFLPWGKGKSSFDT